MTEWSVQGAVMQCVLFHCHSLNGPSTMKHKSPAVGGNCKIQHVFPPIPNDTSIIILLYFVVTVIMSVITPALLT